MKNTEIVILGYSGFIGNHLYNFFLEKKFSVRGISSKEINLAEKKSVKKLKKILNKQTILIIAASVTREKGDDLNAFNTNIKISSNIATVLESIQIKKCLYLSTADVYGHTNNHTITETSPINPQTYYAASKYLSEQILKIAAEKSMIPYLIIRYNGIYGPNQKNIGYGVNYFIKSILKNKIEIWGNGEELRDCVYVKDLVEIISLLSINKSSGILNIATGKSHEYKFFLEKIKKIHNKNPNIVYKKRTKILFNQKFSTKNLFKQINQFKFTDTKLAIKNTYSFYSQNE